MRNATGQCEPPPVPPVQLVAGRLLCALLSTTMRTLQGTSPFGNMSWSGLLRRPDSKPEPAD